jgi:hypothetical protein
MSPYRIMVVSFSMHRVVASRIQSPHNQSLSPLITILVNVTGLAHEFSKGSFDIRIISMVDMTTSRVALLFSSVQRQIN